MEIKYKANIDMNLYETAIEAVDSHTQGEFTRIVLNGFPKLKGRNMIEKMKDLENNYDYLRSALMNEPRGHKDMFGALLTEPVSEEADFGVIFMESTGYINMCGHGTIGCCTVAVNGGLVAVTEPYTFITLDTPAGLVKVRVEVSGGRAKSVTLTNVPSFLYKENLSMEIDGQLIKYDIAFGGNFFALVDITQFGIDIGKENIKEITEIGMYMLRRIAEEVKVKHPLLDINRVDICEFYGPASTQDADMRNVVIFGNHQADRSPCGTGTSAKMAALFQRGKLNIGDTFHYESFIGSIFKGVIKEVTSVGEYPAIIPEITGSANITGVATYLIDPEDRLKYGFSID